MYTMFLHLALLINNEYKFQCPIIKTDTIHYAILFIDTSTMCDTTKDHESTKWEMVF